MKQEIKHSVFIAALLTLALAGCQKKEEAPAPQAPAAETPAPQAAPSAPAPMPETPAPGTAPSGSAPPQESAPGTTPGTPPAQ